MNKVNRGVSEIGDAIWLLWYIFPNTITNVRLNLPLRPSLIWNVTVCVYPIRHHIKNSNGSSFQVIPLPIRSVYRNTTIRKFLSSNGKYEYINRKSHYRLLLCTVDRISNLISSIKLLAISHWNGLVASWLLVTDCSSTVVIPLDVCSVWLNFCTVVIFVGPCA